MRTLILIIGMLFVTNVMAADSCQIVSQNVNTPVPADLKDAKIIVRTKDGKEREMSANEFKVVKRKQQFKVKEGNAVEIHQETIIVKEIVNVSDVNKNLVMLGVRYDYVNLDSSIEGNVIKLYSNKATVFDLSYFRRGLFDSKFGAGISLDTNGTPRGLLGLEF